MFRLERSQRAADGCYNWFCCLSRVVYSALGLFWTFWLKSGIRFFWILAKKLQKILPFCSLKWLKIAKNKWIDLFRALTIWLFATSADHRRVGRPRCAKSEVQIIFFHTIWKVHLLITILHFKKSDFSQNHNFKFLAIFQRSTVPQIFFESWPSPAA